jgi:hypothetical protein
MVKIKSADKHSKNYLYVDGMMSRKYINIVHTGDSKEMELELEMNQETAKELIIELMYRFNIVLTNEK